jgi:hypothetical protein
MKTCKIKNKIKKFYQKERRSVKMAHNVLSTGEFSWFKVIEFKDKGHFCLDDLGGREFPELRESIL